MRKKGNIGELKTEIKDKQISIREKGREISKMKERLATEQRKIDKLDQAPKPLNKEDSRKHNETKEQKNTIEQDIAAKESEIGSIKSEIASIKSDVTTLKKLADQKEKFRDFDETLTRRQNESSNHKNLFEKYKEHYNNIPK